MSDQQFKVGDRVRWGGTLPGTVLAADGNAVWVKWDDRGDRCTVDVADLRPIAKRYVVEIRRAQQGERYMWCPGAPLTVSIETQCYIGGSHTAVPVIVDEVEQ